MLKASVTMEEFRNMLKTKGFIRANTISDVERWNGIDGTITINENEIILSDKPFYRRWNRASGGLALALEYLENLD